MRIMHAARVAFPPLVTLAVVVALWDLAVLHYEIKPYLLPRPLAVLDAAWTKRAVLIKATWVTAVAALAGFACSVGVGTLIAFVFSQSRAIRASGYPYAIFLQTVPIVAIAPLVVNWFGYGLQSVIVVSFIISLFPMITNATTGMLAVDPDLLDLFRLHHASRWHVWLKLRLPTAVPHILTGARTSSGLSVIGAIVGEFFAGYSAKSFGLGYLIQSGTNLLKTSELLATVGASTLLGLLIFGSITAISRTILTRWYDTADG